MTSLHKHAFYVLLIAALTFLAHPAVLHGAPPANGPILHVVRWGENLTQIAAYYQVSVYDIAQANGLADPNRIRVGQRLVIPLSPAPLSPAQDETTHVVATGETLNMLAVQYGTTVAALVQANGLVNPSFIYDGQVLVVPDRTMVQAGGAYHLVRAGDTLPAIAYRYDASYWQIVQANDLPNPSLIQVGQLLFIPDGVAPAGTALELPTRVAAADRVEGWAGKIVSAPAGSEFDDYFEAEDGAQYGVDGIDDAVREQIVAWRDVETTIYVWGTLRHDQPDVNGVQIVVALISESAQAPSSAVVAATATPTSTIACEGCASPVATPAAVPAGSCTVPATPVIPEKPVTLPTPAARKSLQMQSPEYGMTVDLWGMGDCITDRDLALVQEAGFTWVRQVLHWRDIELSKGQFQWNEADRIVTAVAEQGLDLAIAVSHQPEWTGGGYPLNGPPDNMADFAEFMGALAQRYKGLVRAYEIWPGPNVSENWGGRSPNADRYAEMLIDGYWYVKEQDPYAMVISGGLVQTADHDAESIPPFEFLAMLYEHTDAPRACDVWGVQALGFKGAPEHPPEELAYPDLNNHYPATAERNRVWGFRSIEVMHEYTLAPERAIRKQWVVTEMGWTTTPDESSPLYWAAVPEEVKADYLARAFRWAKQEWSDWIGAMFVPLTDARWTQADEGYWWSIVDPDGDTRPSYDALKDMPK
jgi:LysM repeat protein